ncbi:hypothetical protein V3C99_008353, partial [Haemonchus contortus]
MAHTHTHTKPARTTERTHITSVHYIQHTQRTHA